MHISHDPIKIKFQVTNACSPHHQPSHRISPLEALVSDLAVGRLCWQMGRLALPDSVVIGKEKNVSEQSGFVNSFRSSSNSCVKARMLILKGKPMYKCKWLTTVQLTRKRVPGATGWAPGPYACQAGHELWNQIDPGSFMHLFIYSSNAY